MKCPVEVSKKAVVRNWCTKRVREALRKEIAGCEGLRGALCVVVNKDKGVVTASVENVRRECGRIVREVMRVRDSKSRLAGRVLGETAMDPPTKTIRRVTPALQRNAEPSERVTSR